MTNRLERHIDGDHLTHLLYQLTYHKRILSVAGTHQSTIQRYMTDRKLVLGTGSLSQIYLGEYLDHQILTVTKPLNLNQENVKAFIKETNPTFRLQYPHILPLVTLGMSADDIFYLIMDNAFNGTLIQESLSKHWLSIHRTGLLWPRTLLPLCNTSLLEDLLLSFHYICHQRLPSHN